MCEPTRSATATASWRSPARSSASVATTLPSTTSPSAPGVGPGTLYRHFPTRDALLDAVMQVWVDRVTETTDKALTYEGPAREFLSAGSRRTSR